MNETFFYRTFTIDREETAEDGRIKLSFSSEEPVMRFFGAEILLHQPKNVNLERLENFGSVLFNHMPDKIVAAVESAKISGRRGTAVIRFDSDEIGTMALGKVRSGSLRGVSVGYAINDGIRVMDGEEYEARKDLIVKGPAIVAKRWTPYEISLTPIPADSTVGVGRQFTRSLEGINLETIVKPEKPAIGTGLPDSHKYRKKLALHRRF